MIGTLTSYKIIARDTARSLQTVANDRVVKRETAYYEANISKVKSVGDFMNDRRLYGYALRALGMGDMVESRALIRKVLEGGIDDSKSLANSLADPRFRELAETFNFSRYGATTTAFTRTQKGLVDRYMRTTLEENAGQTNEGVRLALYFERKAPDIKSIFNVLADRALYKVVETALALPTSLPGIGIEKQAAIIASKLDVADLKDPAKLSKFMERFANLWDLSASRASADPSLQLFQVNTTGGVSIDTLTSIQNLQKKTR